MFFFCSFFGCPAAVGVLLCLRPFKLLATLGDIKREPRQSAPSSPGRSNCGTPLCCCLLVAFDFFFCFLFLCLVSNSLVYHLRPSLSAAASLAMRLLCANQTNRWSLNYTSKWMVDPSGWPTAAYCLCAVFTSYSVVWFLAVWVIQNPYFRAELGTLVLCAFIMPRFYCRTSKKIKIFWKTIQSKWVHSALSVKIKKGKVQQYSQLFGHFSPPCYEKEGWV